MEIKAFKKILFRSAFFAMSCDGEIHDDEIKEIKSISKSMPLFNGFDIEGELADCVKEASKNPHQAIKHFLDELCGVPFTEHEKNQLLSVTIITVDADQKVVDDELYLLDQLLKSLSLTYSDFAARYPKHHELLAAFKKSGKLKSFSDNMKHLDFSGLVNNNPFLLM